MNSIFNVELLKAQIEIIKKKKYKYVLSVSTSKNDSAYVLFRKHTMSNFDESIELILVKKMSRNRIDFQAEVDSLAKIFNAKIVRT